MPRSLAVLIMLLAIVPAQSADWPHWRGPARNDISSEPSGWNGKTWIKDELWKASVGEGSSSPLVVDGRVYLTGWSKNQDTLVCLGAGTRKEQWR
jgi:outer membrane protein assembly factor BamB